VLGNLLRMGRKFRGFDRVLERLWASRARGRHSERRECAGRGGESSRQARARESRREGEAART